MSQVTCKYSQDVNPRSFDTSSIPQNILNLNCFYIKNKLKVLKIFYCSTLCDITLLLFNLENMPHSI